MVNVGFGNAVNADKVLAVVNPVAAPIRRMVANARENGTAIDATQGRKTKAVVVLENDRIVLSALQPDTIIRRFNCRSFSGTGTLSDDGQEKACPEEDSDGTGAENGGKHDA